MYDVESIFAITEFAIYLHYCKTQFSILDEAQL